MRLGRSDENPEFHQAAGSGPPRNESPVTVIPVIIDAGVRDGDAAATTETLPSRRGSHRRQVTTLGFNEFQREVADLKESIQVLADNVESLMTLHRNVLVAVTDREVARSECALESLIDETNQITRDVAQRLKDLEPKSTAANGVSESDLEMMRIQHLSVTLRFVQHLRAYRRAQVTNRNTFVSHLKRQYRVVKPDATEDEINAVIETQRTPIFASTVRLGSLVSSSTAGTPQTRAALEEVEERHKEIVNLDRSLQELTLLFEHMEHLVEEDDEKLQGITRHVEQAGMDIEKGGEEIARAKRHAEKIRKRKWIYGCLFVLVLAVSVTGLVLGLVLS